MKTREQLIEKIAILEMKRMRFSDSENYCRDKAYRDYTSDYPCGSGDGWADAAHRWKKKKERISDKIHKLVFRNSLGTDLREEYEKVKEFLSLPENKEKVLAGNRQKTAEVKLQFDKEFLEEEPIELE